MGAWGARENVRLSQLLFRLIRFRSMPTKEMYRKCSQGQGSRVAVGNQAIVIGASIGGLLAARALADHYHKVTILERDTLPEASEPRKGVPQGRHPHGLLAWGREVLERLFPGLSEEMVAQGAICGDVVNQALWFDNGSYLPNTPSGLLGLLISRPMLEAGVRHRLLQLPNVRLSQRCNVLEPVFERGQSRVTGLRVRLQGGFDRAETISADLVVDASGRGSRSPAWLGIWGYPKPREENIEVNIVYMTRQFRRRPGHLHGKLAAIIAASRPLWRQGFILAQEGDRWIVALGGYLGDQAPGDEPGYVEFARTLPTPEIFDVIREAEPLSALTPYHFNANVRRRYEELSHFPEGFLVFGDALCSFNPFYGQGMTVACMESLALRECLSAGTQRIARRFFEAASRAIDIPWQMAAGRDLQHPGVKGKRTLQGRLVNWYIAKLLRAAHHDAVLATRFLEVANLMHQPATLLQPRIALRVFSAFHLPALC
jgi:2-polyprenyl-6-methoxyphenol hydroxylase-like FAD-dependent oxidoreductase